MKTATKRDGDGFYTVSDGTYKVTVLRNNELRGPDKWIAGAQWDRHLYTDPLPTKREAVAAARRMIAEKVAANSASAMAHAKAHAGSDGDGWEKCPSVTPGGKPFFYIKKVAEYGPQNWGFWRVVWNRDVLAYAATKDQKHGDRPTLLGYFSTVAEAQAACFTPSPDDVFDANGKRLGSRYEIFCEGEESK